MPKKVLFWMKAFNSEKYIRKAIDSITNQSDPSWSMLVIDNGSTDNTGKICDEYAEKDDRILCYHYKVNYQYTEEEINEFNSLISINNIASPSYAEYVAILDSDDYYHTDFVKVMYAAAKKSNADMAVCGTTLFLDENPNKRACRIPPQAIIKDHHMDEKVFIDLYDLLRPLWGKLYSMNIWTRKDEFAPEIGEIATGLDTYQVLMLLNNCVNTLVSVAQPLHFCRNHIDSDYNSNYDVRRFKDGKILFDLGYKTAKIFNVNTDKVVAFLLKVYFNHVKDLIKLAIVSKMMTPSEKIKYISYALYEELFYKCAKVDPFSVSDLLENAVKKIINGLDELEYAKLERYFLVRMFVEPKEIKGYGAKEIWLFSILCDINNKFHWGSNKFQNIDSSKIDMVVKAINLPLNNTHNLAKKQLLHAIESKDYNLAIEKCNLLKSSIPLDRDTLYFEMYLCLVFKKYVHAVETAVISRVFWSGDQDIESMIQTVYKNVYGDCEASDF